MNTLLVWVKGGEQDQDSGTGAGFGKIVVILAGVSALLACVFTLVSTLLQAKNYRKPLLQRHVVRIFMLVPIFSAASWASLTSLKVAFWIDPFRDVYEAFTLYTFFQLLVNFLGGERSLIIMMHGRPPVPHLWPLDKVLPRVDISDPYTFLSIKRGILQYAWIKPVLAIATVIMKATGTFQSGILAWNSGYFWTGLIYNVSICWSLYDLALFWVCMSDDLQAFRPMPKFLCIKGIIFASWWQGFFLSILVWLGAITAANGDYTADNLAAAIQDALICFEMPFFAISHWYAFSWKDYSDRTISDARMPMRYALRDAFGPRDLIEDAKETWGGEKYDYRNFDAEDNVMAHEESSSRRARMREGMRYERNGRGKYWIPSSGGADSKQPLLQKWAPSNARTMSPGDAHRSRSSGRRQQDYGTNTEPEEPELDPEEERLYPNARALEFGDWNYPVINTHYATREDRIITGPNLITPSTNRAILQPSAAQRRRRISQIKTIQEETEQHRKTGSSGSHDRGSSSSGGADGDSGGAEQTIKSHLKKGKEKIESLPIVGDLARQKSDDSNNSRSSQLVDLVIEDKQATEIERVRARKEGGPGWNSVGESRHFVQTYISPDDRTGTDGAEPVSEFVRRGFNPDRPEITVGADTSHTLGGALDAAEDQFYAQENAGKDEVEQDQPWEERTYVVGGDEDEDDGEGGGGEHEVAVADDDDDNTSPFQDERNAWSG